MSDELLTFDDLPDLVVEQIYAHMDLQSQCLLRMMNSRCRDLCPIKGACLPWDISMIPIQNMTICSIPVNMETGQAVAQETMEFFGTFFRRLGRLDHKLCGKRVMMKRYIHLIQTLIEHDFDAFDVASEYTMSFQGFIGDHTMTRLMHLPVTDMPVYIDLVLTLCARLDRDRLLQATIRIGRQISARLEYIHCPSMIRIELPRYYNDYGEDMPEIGKIPQALTPRASGDIDHITTFSVFYERESIEMYQTIKFEMQFLRSILPFMRSYVPLSLLQGLRAIIHRTGNPTLDAYLEKVRGFKIVRLTEFPLSISERAAVS